MPGEGEQLCLSLVVDVEPAISHLSFSIPLENELEAKDGQRNMGGIQLISVHIIWMFGDNFITFHRFFLVV